MTYQDPKNMMPSPNPPRYRPPEDDNSWGTGSVIAAVVAGALVIGGLVYAFSGRDTTTASAPNTTTSSPATTGQGGGTMVNPGSRQNTPNPTPPASNPTPPAADPGQASPPANNP